METRSSSEPVDLIERLGRRDPQALIELFAKHRERLQLMVRMRIDTRLRPRVDPSDVLQEAYTEAWTRYEKRGYDHHPAHEEQWFDQGRDKNELGIGFDRAV